MKKALVAALCFMLVSFMFVSGTFALPDLGDVFATFTGTLGELLGTPQPGGAGTAVDVKLVSVSDTGSQILSPGGAVTRTSYVHNQGDGDVYFRLVYAVQYDEKTWDKLMHVSFTAESGFTDHGWQDITIGTTPYKMKVFTYNAALAAKGYSPKVSVTIKMDPGITSEDMSRYRSDFLQMQVLAISAAQFAEANAASTAVDALNLALPLGANFNPF